MFLSKLFKKELAPIQTELLQYGWVKDEKYNKINKVNSNGFADITVNKGLIWIGFKHNKDLSEEYHDKVWDELTQLVPTIDSRFQLGCLGFEFLQITTNDENNITAIELNDIVDKYCEEIYKIIEPLL
jgi:hypothetical protein